MFASVLSIFAFIASVASATTPPTYGPVPGGYGGYGGYTPAHMPGDGAGCARRWESCGAGAGYNGTTCCVGFNECVRQNDYYAMCTPMNPMPDGYVAEYGHCTKDSWPTCEPLTQCKKNPGPGDVSLCLDPVHERKKQHDCSKAARYQQCSGTGWTGPQTCRGQNYCKFVNDYYSMCSPIKNATDAGCAEEWSGCGGREYKGPGCCAEGLTCKYVNEWYSQCQPVV